MSDLSGGSRNSAPKNSAPTNSASKNSASKNSAFKKTTRQKTDIVVYLKLKNFTVYLTFFQNLSHAFSIMSKLILNF